MSFLCVGCKRHHDRYQLPMLAALAVSGASHMLVRGARRPADVYVLNYEEHRPSSETVLRPPDGDVLGLLKSARGCFQSLLLSAPWHISDKRNATKTNARVAP